MMKRCLIRSLVWCMLLAIQLVKAEDGTVDTSLALDQPVLAETFARAVDGLSQDDDNLPSSSSAFDGAIKKRSSDETSVGTGYGSRDDSVAALYRRSALNKNFIRFGRSGYIPKDNNKMAASEPNNWVQREDEEGPQQEPFNIKRYSPLTSNFIRFGRSGTSSGFGPGARYGPMRTGFSGFFPVLNGQGSPDFRRYNGKRDLSSNFIRFGRSFHP